MYGYAFTFMYLLIDTFLFMYIFNAQQYKTKARARIVQVRRTTTTSKVVIGSSGAPALQLAIRVNCRDPRMCMYMFIDSQVHVCALQVLKVCAPTPLTLERFDLF